MHEGILKGIRGPRGGYELARPQSAISAEDILRAASTAEGFEDAPTDSSRLVNSVVWPALREAERMFSAALARISVEDMTQKATTLK